MDLSKATNTELANELERRFEDGIIVMMRANEEGGNSTFFQAIHGTPGKCLLGLEVIKALVLHNYVVPVTGLRFKNDYDNTKDLTEKDKF
jgi:hypothetical protein